VDIPYGQEEETVVVGSQETKRQTKAVLAHLRPIQTDHVLRGTISAAHHVCFVGGPAVPSSLGSLLLMLLSACVDWKTQAKTLFPFLVPEAWSLIIH
jgi:hypothetical protein